VQKGGALAGYRWGVRRKATLLASEARRARDDEPATAAIEEDSTA
jgi:AraC family transcriptional regulator of adaptative response/methylated-DNA-[protein]-cysteine methyltransferase